MPPPSYARRTNCKGCGVPNMRKPNRRCRYCGTKACEDCVKKCCAKAIENKKKSDERDFKHLAAYYMRWLEDHHVKLSPVVEKTPKGQKAMRWMAGYVELAGDGYQNVVHRQAAGETPIEAMQNLANGKYYAGGA